MEECNYLFDRFKKNAELVSAKVRKIKTVSEAIDYLCGRHNLDLPFVR